MNGVEGPRKCLKEYNWCHHQFDVLAAAVALYAYIYFLIIVAHIYLHACTTKSGEDNINSVQWGPY